MVCVFVLEIYFVYTLDVSNTTFGENRLLKKYKLRAGRQPADRTPKGKTEPNDAVRSRAKCKGIGNRYHHRPASCNRCRNWQRTSGQPCNHFTRKWCRRTPNRGPRQPCTTEKSRATCSTHARTVLLIAQSKRRPTPTRQHTAPAAGANQCGCGVDGVPPNTQTVVRPHARLEPKGTTYYTACRCLPARTAKG